MDYNTFFEDLAQKDFNYSSTENILVNFYKSFNILENFIQAKLSAQYEYNSQYTHLEDKIHSTIINVVDTNEIFADLKNDIKELNEQFYSYFAELNEKTIPTISEVEFLYKILNPIKASVIQQEEQKGTEVITTVEDLNKVLDERQVTKLSVEANIKDIVSDYLKKLKVIIEYYEKISQLDIENDDQDFLKNYIDKIFKFNKTLIQTDVAELKKIYDRTGLIPFEIESEISSNIPPQKILDKGDIESYGLHIDNVSLSEILKDENYKKHLEKSINYFVAFLNSEDFQNLSDKYINNKVFDFLTGIKTEYIEQIKPKFEKYKDIILRSGIQAIHMRIGEMEKIKNELNEKINALNWKVYVDQGVWDYLISKFKDNFLSKTRDIAQDEFDFFASIYYRMITEYLNSKTKDFKLSNVVINNFNVSFLKNLLGLYKGKKEEEGEEEVETSEQVSKDVELVLNNVDNIIDNDINKQIANVFIYSYIINNMEKIL